MKIVILASGEGSNFESIVQASQKGDLSAEVAGLISSREGVRALERAKRLGVPAEVISAKDYASSDLWNQALLARLKKWECDWVVLAGFTGLIGPSLLAMFPSRIVNSHPSLLPKFGGKGMYGIKVHESVLRAREKESGVTVHLLNERFDEGPIMAQKRIPVLPGDTPQTLSERLKAEERLFYPAVLEDLLTGRIKTR